MWCTCHSDIVPQIIHSVFADAGGVAASRSLRRHIYDNNHIIMGASHKQLHANYLMCIGGTMPETETTRAFACISRFSMWPRAERRRNVRHLQYIYIFQNDDDRWESTEDLMPYFTWCMSMMHMQWMPFVYGIAVGAHCTIGRRWASAVRRRETLLYSFFRALRSRKDEMFEIVQVFHFCGIYVWLRILARSFDHSCDATKMRIGQKNSLLASEWVTCWYEFCAFIS